MTNAKTCVMTNIYDIKIDMKAFRQIVLAVVIALVAVKGFAQSTTDNANANANANAQDCAALDWQVINDPLLTRKEKIERLDQALLKSLNNAGLCHDATNSTGAGGQGAGGQGAGSQSAGGEGAGNAGVSASTVPIESVPTSNIQGDIQDNTPAAEEARELDDTIANKPTQNNRAGKPSSSKVPEDIPPAENDDIIAQQFRQAAIDETDPDTKEKLWNEYRRYKNLPVQDSPET